MEPIAEIGLGSDVYRLMRALHRYDSGRTLSLLHASKLTTPQVAMLEFLSVSRTVSAIAAYMGLSKSATSQLVDRLVERGLLARHENSADRRERLISLTAKGRELTTAVVAARIARFNLALAGLPPGLAARLRDVLGEVNEALETPAADPVDQSLSL